MHPIRKQRLQIVLLIILAAACASGLVIYMLGQNTNYFYTPSQIQSGEAPHGVCVRAGGLVVEGSVERDLDSLDVAFKVTDGGAAVLVKYSGILHICIDLSSLHRNICITVYFTYQRRSDTCGNRCIDSRVARVLIKIYRVEYTIQKQRE